MQKPKLPNGFTLIELLVVVSLIGILASFSFAAYSGSQQRGRDGQRKFDLRNLSSALEQYYSQNQTYPTSISGASPSLTNPPTGQSTYLKVVPTDPTPGRSYWYSASCTNNVCSNYFLCAQLENANDQDTDVNTGKYRCPDQAGSHASWYGFQAP